ncbi:uncharacterized protein VTP21DRAFT_6700 [Calcarisporiella thermophila]|uniref:uncharacterized protein n=1 Tax=Calcarisporiella thermophila TaxID=911321 RepID=UPI003744670D
MRSIVTFTILSLLTLAATPIKAAPIARAEEIDKRMIGYGAPYIGRFPFFANNQFYANAANVDNRFRHDANLAASVKANEATHAHSNANTFNVGSVNTATLKRRNCYGSPHIWGGGWGFPAFFNSAFQLNAANVNNRFSHDANLAANVVANEATTAKNSANTFNTAAVSTTHMKRCHGFGGWGYGDVGCDCFRYGTPFGGYGIEDAYLGWGGYECGLPYGGWIY